MAEITTRLELFKDAALSQGHSQEDIDSFLGTEEVQTILGRSEEIPDFDFDTESFGGVGDFPIPGEGQSKVLASVGPVTQRFGAYNPRVEKFSGGINRGTDFGVPTGTKVATPQGNWVVAESFGGSRSKGFIGSNVNRGYGNSVVIKNRKTGERIRYSHLSRVGVKPGQTLKGGQVVALTGQTGSVTGPHLDIEYYDTRGRLRDILKSKYGRQIV